MHQMAVITPFAQFIFKFLLESLVYARLSSFLMIVLSRKYRHIFCFCFCFCFFFCSNIVIGRFAMRMDIMRPAPLETKYQLSEDLLRSVLPNIQLGEMLGNTLLFSFDFLRRTIEESQMMISQICSDEVLI